MIKTLITRAGNNLKRNNLTAASEIIGMQKAYWFAEHIENIFQQNEEEELRNGRHTLSSYYSTFVEHNYLNYERL